MHTLLSTALCAVAIVAVDVAGARGEEPAPTGDLAQLQGQWTAMFGRQQNIPLVVTIKGTSATFSMTRSDGQQRDSKGEIKIDENARPNKTIDWVKFIGRNGVEAPPNLGIYTFKDGAIVVCNGGPGNPRPTEFKAGERGGPQLLTLHRKTGTASPGELTGDLAKLQGRWSGKGGRERNVAIVVTIQGSNAAFSITPPDGQTRESKGEIKIDENAKPHKTLDWVNFVTASGETARENLAIYLLKGDTLTICSGGAGNERPTEFKAGEGGRPSLVELRHD
jgi:uncharacterized protein (TIGR03067 family)